MNTLRTTRLWIILAILSLGTGCFVPYDSGPYGSRGPHHYGRGAGGGDEVEGTIERIDSRRLLILEGEGPGGRERAIYYDDHTVVEHEGQTYQPQVLERGDHIQANVRQTETGLVAERIEVLEDGPGGEDVEEQPTPQAAPHLSGTVRRVDPRSHTLEIEPASREGGPGVVRLQYDSSTIVEHEGQRYAPENLERGDAVEIDLADADGRWPLAQRIVVPDEDQPPGR
jgi:hypothetical protein